MLTEKAIIGRQWGAFPALFKLLGEKRLSTNWTGPTSVSDNMFESITRILEIYALVQENSEEVRLTLQAEGPPEGGNSLPANLERLSYELAQVSEFFADAAGKTRTLSR
jgi:hypothetical protein